MLTLIVTGWCIDGHATVHAQHAAVIPHLSDVAMGNLVHAIEAATVSLLFRDNDNVGGGSHIAVDVDACRVEHLPAVHKEDIGIHLWTERRCSDGPDTFGVFHHGEGLVGNLFEIADNTHLFSFWVDVIEGDAPVGIDNGGIYLRKRP